MARKDNFIKVGDVSIRKDLITDEKSLQRRAVQLFPNDKDEKSVNAKVRELFTTAQDALNPKKEKEEKPKKAQQPQPAPQQEG